MRVKEKTVTHWVLFVGYYDTVAALWLYTCLNSALKYHVDTADVKGHVHVHL